MAKPLVGAIPCTSLAWQFVAVLSCSLLQRFAADVSGANLTYVSLKVLDDLEARRGSPWRHGNGPGSCDFFPEWVAERRKKFSLQTQKAGALHRLTAALQAGTPLSTVDPAPLVAEEVDRLKVWFAGGPPQMAGVPDPASLDRYIYTKGKILLDMEQLGYLISRGLLPSCFWKVLQPYMTIFSHIADHPDEQRYVSNQKSFETIGLFYNTFLFMPELPRLENVINPKFESKLAQRQYELSSPNFVIADGLLTREALDALLRFTTESTIFYEYKLTYSGAYIADGFAHPLLAQVVQGLRDCFPNIIGDLPLANQWAYKYDHNTTGIPPHADNALVNVNFWILPDKWNKDPDSGGIKIILKEPPDDFNMDDYNVFTGQDVSKQAHFADAQTVTVPYKQNRIVMFKSTLLHSTVVPNFKPGYSSRRINLTFLFGHRNQAEAQKTFEL